MKSVNEALAFFEAHAGTTWKEIKARYRILMLKHHPDKGGAKEYCQVINEAYKLISEHQQNNKSAEVMYSAAPGGVQHQRETTFNDDWTEEECR